MIAVSYVRFCPFYVSIVFCLLRFVCRSDLFFFQRFVRYFLVVQRIQPMAVCDACVLV